MTVDDAVGFRWLDKPRRRCVEPILALRVRVRLCGCLRIKKSLACPILGHGSLSLEAKKVCHTLLES